MTGRKCHRCFQLFVVCCLLELFAGEIFLRVFGALESGPGVHMHTNTSMWGIWRGRQPESNLSCEWWKRSMPVNALTSQPLPVCSYCNSGLLPCMLPLAIYNQFEREISTGWWGLFPFSCHSFFSPLLLFIFCSSWSCLINFLRSWRFQHMVSDNF